MGGKTERRKDEQSTDPFSGGERTQMVPLSLVPPVGDPLPQLTPRNPSLLLVMDSGSRGWKRASMVSVSSLGSGGRSSSS